METTHSLSFLELRTPHQQRMVAMRAVLSHDTALHGHGEGFCYFVEMRKKITQIDGMGDVLVSLVPYGSFKI